MSKYNTIFNMCSVVRDHVNPKYKEEITFDKDINVIRIKIDSRSVAFIVIDKPTSTVSKVDLSHGNIMARNWIISGEISTLYRELNDFIGKKV